MPRLSVEQLSQEWGLLNQKFSQQSRRFVLEFCIRHAVDLTETFYSEMMADPAASLFLSHDQVQGRLSLSMRRWLEGLFDSEDEVALARIIAEQKKVGEVHARIDIPVHLVLRGARCLKDRFISLLQEDCELSEREHLDAARLMSDTVDLAMEIMSHAYSASHDRNSRNEEAYRLFSVTQNIATEKERQRAALFDWENQLMFDQAVGQSGEHLPRILASEFGLWFRHKGAHAFEGAPEAQQILDAMERIDDVILPLFDQDPAERIARLRELRETVKAIRFSLDHLFEQNNELEAGRDVLTRLLNRKFLPVVLTRQVSHARSHGTPFSVLALDIDYFKQINDSYGHEAGDRVLQQLASLLINSSRAGDYLFRLGGEEFLMLLVDTGLDGARRVAEKLRRGVEQEVFRLPQDRTLNITLSIGVACFNGHPDYQQLMRRADDGLYQAKHSGRNRVVVVE
ncbi:diguanylate cyclase [Halopseudomonas aestusnigri]|uniref:diguanylate cyclase n=1 Tax=Halopseudomonas TaxID=2901189 RepID=UPI0022B749A9|nr:MULTISPECIES: diguanylate cyclase [Halopseudomonas]MDL2200939.1 diguanylate cyclase [Halopseudomonas aestusnigri]BDX20650.1 diguanylate cyclase [Halopseudomonas aestusnigri]GMQ53562.1 diguanylate cyclase [Halopseudomonas aestusnigri]